jgi:ribose transport system ATP-binding protein
VVLPNKEQEPVVRMEGVSKRYPGVVAVDNASVVLYPSEVQAVSGENGAGKSTLMKMLAQVERPTSGQIFISGQPAPYHGPRYAQERGIAMVFQEFATAPHLTVAQNLFLGREPMASIFINRRAETNKARELLERVGLDINPQRTASSLSVAEQQLVEIAKALAINAKVLILDEPTATLTEREIEKLFSVIRDLTAHGIGIFYISHRMEEMFTICDRITVMRDGKVVDTLPTSELDQGKLIRMMVGREIGNLYPKPQVQIGEVVLRAEGITRKGVLHDCSFVVRAGEILGFAGLIGAGRTELARAVFGADLIDSGRIQINGRDVQIKTPRDGIEAGIGYLTEDRKREGLALMLGIDQNITLANLPMQGFLINLGAERRIAYQEKDQLRIRTPSIRQICAALSGGNQQKVVVAKWLETKVQVFFFDEPSRGIDVGAKAEMFDLIGKLAQEGRAIVMISSYMPELINMCDRILVMREGHIAGELSREQFSEENIIALATGVKEAHAA